MKLKVVKMFEDVKLPEYATEGSACFDIYSRDLVGAGNLTETYSTGLKFEIPENHVMLVFSRSGHGFNKDIRLANCVGVIDSDYRGELKVKLTCDDPDAQFVNVAQGERIAQGMVIPYQQVVFVESETLSETARGECGFGSTNV